MSESIQTQSADVVTGMLPIPEVSDVDMAFPTARFIPKIEDIPEQFWRSGNRFSGIAGSWFFNGLPNGIEGVGLKAKAGVDQQKALRAIHETLGSWSPKHEHKMAACGYMLSEWFEFMDGEQ